MTHCLKTKPRYFNTILSGLKTFELRKSDRNYHINDELILAEYDTTFTGRKVSARISYILNVGDICQEAANYVILGLSMHDISEFQNIIDYVKSADWNNHVCFEQLCALWTAYCIHNHYECDTYAYDTKLRELYEEYAQHDVSLTVEQFDEYMCEHLV